MLELQHISYITPDAAELLHDVSLTVTDQLTAITGPNGGGKSTLAKVIAGIHQPTSGRILLDGEDITHLSVTQRARKGVSYAFQQPVKFKGLTVRNLMDIAAGQNMCCGDACEYLSEVGLCAKDYLDRELNDTLSGGELKRIEIAMIFARGTKLTILDEPEAGIDLWSFQSLIHVFENMQKKCPGNILIISHQERILNIANRIIYLKDGRIADSGARDEMMPRLMGADAACSRLTGKMEGVQ